MRLGIEVDLEYRFAEPADVLLQIEAAVTAGQKIVHEALTIWSDDPIRAVIGEDGMGQRCWSRGRDNWQASYRATVSVDRPAIDMTTLPATAPRDLDGHLVPYLLPSRYCPADRFEGFVKREFPGLEGGALAAALVDWVADALTYENSQTTGETTALETFASRGGVCRDYAHLLVSLARAGNIPARCVSAYAPGVDPPDFHAVAELWLDGAWHLADATRMAACGDLAQVAVGRDASDIAFMTVFGRAELVHQTVRVIRLQERETPMGR